MSATSNQNYKIRYVITAIAILIIIATICYLVFFKSEKPKPPHTGTTTGEKPNDETIKKKNDKDKDRPNQEKNPKINVVKTPANSPQENAEKTLQNLDYSCIPALVEDVIEFRCFKIYYLDSEVRARLADELAKFRKTKPVRTFKSILNRAKENEQIKASNCPDKLNTPKIVDHYNETMHKIYGKYNSCDSLLVDPQGNFDFLNEEYMDQIFEDGDIKSSIGFESFENVKNPLFKNIPISILINMEINLLQIKEGIIQYFLKLVKKHMDNMILLMSEYEKSKGTENHEKVKEAMKELNDYYGPQELDLKKLIINKDKLTNEHEHDLKKYKEIIANLNKLKDFILKESGISVD